ncbi:MAG: LysM peptidoglycan-binding domain-containing protein [Cycloclasticus sp.]|nr:MAG: peptidoglycan-binding LysM-like protein [Cycloclasticus sp. Phe_18]MBV1912600.1 LysM peptidoglycan-binding domain-containing protein [Cycloclasticus sp.]
MKKLLVLLFCVLLSWNVLADDIKLNPSHPERYVVVKGDTLWDISARFLQTPWRWPDIWQANDQIANPHLIYPGDIIELSFIDGVPRLTLKRGDGKLSPSIRRSSLDDAIPAIPIDAIAPFLNNPRVMTQEEYDSAPYIVAFDDEHILGSPGYKAYVRSFLDGIDDGYTIVRQGEEYLDGETGESLGFESIYIAESAVTLKGDPATVMLSKSTREVRKGDRLLPAIEGPIVQNYFPHAPDSDIKGRIVGVVDGVSQVARFDVVVIDRGMQDGVEVGHVLEIDRAGETVRDVIAGGGKKVTLPDEKAGVLMVFRVFDRVSYGLIMESKRVIHRHDVVRTP